MKLDETDYQNIFLRVREKLVIQLFFLISALAVTAGLVTWLAAKEKIEDVTEAAVTNYVNSEQFADNIMTSYRESVASLDAQLAELSAVISQQQIVASQLSQSPVLQGSTGLTFIGQDGSHFRIEIGTASSGDKVVFQSTYKSEPTVILSIDTNSLDSVSLHRLQSKGVVVFALNTSETGFDVPHEMSPIAVRWVALGEQ